MGGQALNDGTDRTDRTDGTNQIKIIMTTKYAVGTRLLITRHPGANIEHAEVREYSPSGVYVGLEVGCGEFWAPWASLGVTEVLQEPTTSAGSSPSPRPSPPGEGASPDSQTIAGADSPQGGTAGATEAAS